MKPGYKTTEFWTTVVAIVCATVLLALDKISGGAWATVMGIGSGGYGLARGITKGSYGEEEEDDGVH